MLLHAIILFSSLNLALSQYNPTILQDSRNEPKLDGTFGFLYKTEDGISHAAKADPGGVVHGRFTYTDPTGLKVNFNYNAGSSVTPGYKYDEQPVPVGYQPQQQPQQAQTRYTRPPQPVQQNYQQQDYQPQDNYQPQNNYQPRNTRRDYQQDNYQQDNSYQQSNNKVSSYESNQYF